MAMLFRAVGICIIAIILVCSRPPVALAQSPVAPTAPTTVSQCDQLIQVANRATDAAQQLSQNPSSDSIRDLLDTANIADRAIGEMQALSLTDSELLKFRDQFVTMYEGVSRAIRDLVEAANQQDQEAGEQAFTALQTATAAEETLVPAINRYCERTAQRLTPR
ncbi:MAG: hypothetical protein EDM05_055675 [Leptolyngbya sp. IPPAS B-1204]|uniref:DUF4168 domain-containing protein n=1 Tax=Leptolyngbya sp. NK1-12 TaxID=2547451 RepID=A0AA96WB94_9CYAN|nr:hypothetical protein [Leptolyngbya sp. NK1-12]MBF2046157.1 hypothetical protein [Elainella sp. C42_A2020_010]RNJ70119.1 MAG: hypothetical protein EDM05_05345 [Leptolyngbya sp. IPPAS B-1204]WNZ23182.1 hypothetical protein HJG54_10160 [Leptolyngbya sp. NK1-12]